jgi:hypothetical protein
MRELGLLHPPVDRFFADVLVMAEDRNCGASLPCSLGCANPQIGDISEIAPDAGPTGNVASAEAGPDNPPTVGPHF